MDAFYEEDQRIVGHAADIYHRIDIRPTSRHLVVRDGDRVVADTTRPLALYESGFAPRWYVPRADVDESALTAAKAQTFCQYKGVSSYYDIGDARGAAWSYLEAWPEVGRIAGFISFEPDKVEVSLDGKRLRLEPGQTVIAHGRDSVRDRCRPGAGVLHAAGRLPPRRRLPSGRRLPRGPMTPPGSACSVQIGVGLTGAPPGATPASCLAVADIEAAHRELTGRAVKVSDIRHKAPVEDWQGGWEPGPDPRRRDYASFADFADPDGNTWTLQEIGYLAS